MLNQTLVIARKEITDHLRETRSLWATVMHLLMGPVILLLVKNKAPVVVQSMSAIFLIVSSFTGGMNASMDMLAGERERRSLLPLLLNPVSRMSVVMGKWLAISTFAASGVVLTYAAFAIVGVTFALPFVLALLPLTALAAAMQLTISTFCRTVKEAQTYLSLLIFLPMGLSIFLVFIGPSPSTWLRFAPTLVVAAIWCTALALQYSASLLKRDEIVYGR